MVVISGRSYQRPLRWVHCDLVTLYSRANYHCDDCVTQRDVQCCEELKIIASDYVHCSILYIIEFSNLQGIQITPILYNKIYIPVSFSINLLNQYTNKYQKKAAQLFLTSLSNICACKLPKLAQGARVTRARRKDDGNNSLRDGSRRPAARDTRADWN